MTTPTKRFGGTSVGTAEALSQVPDIVMQHSKWNRLVSVSHNTLRGAASGSIRNAELLGAERYVK